MKTIFSKVMMFGVLMSVSGTCAWAAAAPAAVHAAPAVIHKKIVQKPITPAPVTVKKTVKKKLELQKKLEKKKEIPVKKIH